MTNVVWAEINSVNSSQRSTQQILLTRLLHLYQPLLPCCSLLICSLLICSLLLCSNLLLRGLQLCSHHEPSSLALLTIELGLLSYFYHHMFHQPRLTNHCTLTLTIYIAHCTFYLRFLLSSAFYPSAVCLFS